MGPSIQGNEADTALGLRKDYKVVPILDDFERKRRYQCSWHAVRMRVADRIAIPLSQFRLACSPGKRPEAGPWDAHQPSRSLLLR